MYITKYVAFDRPIDLGELVCEVLLSFEHLWEEKDIDLKVIQIINDEMPAGIDGSFNLCDVRDLARGTSLAADKGQCGSCYILGNQEVSFKDFSPMVSQEAGCKKIKVFLPHFIAGVLENQARRTGKRPSMTTFSVYNLARNNDFDSSKARDELGYTTRSYQETIRDEIAWLRKTGKIA